MRNAIIMAAGMASRFVPLSQDIPKGLLEIKGEILIERQIKQLKESGISDITIIVGYKADMFYYLKDKFNVQIVENIDYYKYNNTSSLIRVLDRLDNTYICCSDNYFHNNVFTEKTTDSYYSALYANGETKEYCLITNDKDEITNVTIGGRDSWYMVGHAFFNHEFSMKFREIMINEYKNELTKHKYWEDVYIKYINQLPKIKIHKYNINTIEEFDTLDELRLFDESYKEDTRSSVLKEISKKLSCREGELTNFKGIKDKDGLVFTFDNNGYQYIFNNGKLAKCLKEV